MWLVVAALAIFICLFSHPGALGLVGPDEPRYAWIAREMADAGDWVTPRLYGAPWFEKPVLYYWAAAVGFGMHLPAERAARLPSALSALVSALAIGWLGWKRAGLNNPTLKTPAILAPLLLSTSVAAIGFARAGGPDMLFTAALTLAMAAAAVVLLRKETLRADGAATAKGCGQVPLLIWFGASVGFAVLAKGPAGMILAGGAVGVWTVATGSWRAALSLLHPAAILSFCTVALPWYIVCALRNPDFLRVFVLEHNVNRYLTPVFQHPQPVWFFVVILVLGMMPWSGIGWGLAKEVRRSIRERGWKDSPEFFLACWVIFPVLFFCFSKSKLPGYILPSFPPLALLLALVLGREKGLDDSPARWHAIALGLTWIALGISANFWLRRLPGTARESVHTWILALEVVVLICGVVMTALAFFRARGAVFLSLLLTVMLVEFAGLRILPALDPFLSARTVGQLLQQDRRPDRIFTYRVSRSWTFGLSFYLHREIRDWNPDDPEAALVLTTRHGARELEKLGRFRGPAEEVSYEPVLLPVLPSPR